MRNVLVALLWLWFMVAVGYWIWRGARAVSGDKRKTEDVKVANDDDLRTTRPLDLSTGEERGEPVDPGPAPPPTPIAGAPDAPAEAGASIFDAPSDGPATTSSAPIADLLAGISMPCDLAPLLDGAPRPGARETVTFSTVGHAPQDVGRALGEELRRLGFELEPVTPMHVRARKEGGAVELEVHPDPKNLTRHGEPVYRFATDATVVVEIWR